MLSTLLNDTNFWVLISFVIFMGVAWKYGRKTALAGLDDKINSIQTELTTAEKLRVEAQELLAEYQRKHKDALREADDIIAKARAHADSMRVKAESDLEETMKRREDQLQQSLARIEQNAANEIQAYTAQIAINAARDLMTKNMTEKNDKAIINNHLETLSKVLN